MSIAIANFAIGASLATLAILYFVRDAPSPRVVVLVSGGWAMVPDAASLDPSLGRFRPLSDSVWANVFWSHQRIDTIDAADSLWFAGPTIAVFIGATAVAERWEYTVREHAADPEAGFDPGQSLGTLRRVPSLGAIGYSAVLFGGALLIEQFTVLYVGTGAALGLAGLIGSSGVGWTDRTPSRPSRWWTGLPDRQTMLAQLGVTFGTLVIAGGLVTSLRSLGPLDAVYVGTALLLVTLLADLATQWS